MIGEQPFRLLAPAIAFVSQLADTLVEHADPRQLYLQFRAQLEELRIRRNRFRRNVSRCVDRTLHTEHPFELGNLDQPLAAFTPGVA